MTFYTRVFALVAAGVLGVVLFRIVQPFLDAILWAALLAFLLRPFARRLRTKLRGRRGRRGLAAGLTTLGVTSLAGAWPGWWPRYPGGPHLWPRVARGGSSDLQTGKATPVIDAIRPLIAAASLRDGLSGGMTITATGLPERTRAVSRQSFLGWVILSNVTCRASVMRR